MNKSNRVPIFFRAAALGVLLIGLTGAMPLLAAPIILSGALDARLSGSQETGFGDLAADAVLAAAPGADFALVPAGELHSVSVASGQSSTEALTQALRTGNDSADTVVVMKLTGAQVKAALAHGLSREPSPYDGFLQVSGLTINFDPAKHGAARVEKAIVDSTRTPLDPASNYSVAMPRYLADGALGYFELWSGAPAYNATSISLATAVSNYAAAHQPINGAGSANRIVAAK